MPSRTRPLVLLAALSALACPSRPRPVIYDLAARAGVAELSSAREVLRFSTPATEPHLADGFFQETAGSEGVGYVWSRIDCELAFTWPGVANRAALVDLEPFHGVAGQKARVTLNGQPVGEFTVDARRRYRVELPAAAQRVGDNRVKFFFATSASPSSLDPKSSDTRQLAAAFHDMIVSGASDPVLTDLLGRDAPPPILADTEGGVPRIVQVGTSTLRFALALPENAELRFTPELHRQARAAGAAATFRVTVDDGHTGEREVWSQTLSGREEKPREVAVALTDRQPSILRVSLSVGGEKDARFAWGIWRSPRVVASRRFDPLAPAPFTDAERRGGDAIRQALGDVNVVLVILDAGRAAEFGCYGYKAATTPNIDAVARESVVFERAFTPAVYTLGAMSSVWTSEYPDRHHSAVSFASKLPKDRITLAELLSPRGIYTAGFVANAIAGAFSGFDRGFDEFHEVYREQQTSNADAFRKVLPVWLASHRDRRFFAYVHFREPHFPYDPPPPFDTKFGPDGPVAKASRRDSALLNAVNQGHPSPEQIAHLSRLYDGNLAFADQEVGRLRDALQQAGLWERTVFIVAADHGEQLFEHGWMGHNVQLFDESMHVPLIVHFPAGKGPSGVRLAPMVDLLDVAPTILDLFGRDPAPGFEGRSLLPVIAGAPGKPAVLSRTIWDRPRYALRTETEKFVYDSRSGEESLYDLAADPRESRDRDKEEAIKAAYYRETLHTTVARLTRRNATAAADVPTMTCEQCRNMQALGYISTDCAQLCH